MLSAAMQPARMSAVCEPCTDSCGGARLSHSQSSGEGPGLAAAAQLRGGAPLVCRSGFCVPANHQAMAADCRRGQAGHAGAQIVQELPEVDPAQEADEQHDGFESRMGRKLLLEVGGCCWHLLPCNESLEKGLQLHVCVSTLCA
jgi:hypothetical protein